MREIETGVAVTNCPVDKIILLDDCKKCPYYGFLGRDICEYEDPKEIPIEPSKDKEYETKW